MDPPPSRPSDELAPDPYRALLYRRVLGGDPACAQLWFDPRVLERYRQQSGARVIRTNTAGRVSGPGGWSLDFGIADQDRVIHASAGDLGQRLPPSERQHWLDHALSLPLSRNFITMRLGSGGCIDDGELRDWFG